MSNRARHQQQLAWRMRHGIPLEDGPDFSIHDVFDVAEYMIADLERREKEDLTSQYNKPIGP